MSTDLNITIHRLEQTVCDLTDKEADCVVCAMADDTECVISTSKFLEFLRFEQKKADRKNGRHGTAGAKVTDKT